MDKNGVAVFADRNFDLRIKDGAITSLKYMQDLYDTEFIWKGRRFGDIFITYEISGRKSNEISTAKLIEDNCFDVSADERLMKYTVSFNPKYGEIKDISLDITYELKDSALYYEIKIQNECDRELEVQDISIPYPMNSSFEWGKKPYETVLRHSFVSGNCSYMFWMRSNGLGPYLLMTPIGNTKLEYYDMFDDTKYIYRAYIHSKAQGEIARSKGCRWRQPNTSMVLNKKGMNGDSVSYSFKFQWAKDYDEVKKSIVDEGLIDVEVVPGMTIPLDLYALISLKTKQFLKSVEAEFPDKTEIYYMGKKEEDNYIYKVKFHKLGENYIKINYGKGKYLLLEFFSTEPVETLIKKRAAFIAKCQHKDPSKWYNGLISEWNMETKTLLGPDNYDRIKGWRIYEVSCDDPGLSKPAFLAAKNAYYPVLEEIEALDYYIENFVWGGLQKTDREEYSYGIYGIPDWNSLRYSKDDGYKGKLHIWRIYDYPHIVLLYWSMYNIAKNYPDIKTKLTKEVYLERAYRTAISMFTIPLEIVDWSAYKTGLYNELIIEDIIDELYLIGWSEKATRLKMHWERKVRHFVKENSDLFGSEYPFDSTGFESTHAISKYALRHAKKLINEEYKKDEQHDINLSEAVKFMESQIRCNIACRGWLEPAYYLLGSDYRGSGNASYTLSYMSQMGGWAVLDYALYYSDEPYKYLRLGYASILSSWALMNTGTLESDYGYWYPGFENDGAAGGGFEPSPFGYTWLEQEHHRGSWYYACEIDLGFCGALRGASTILADDPIFGLFCYGGEFIKEKDSFKIIMKDGIRRRFHILYGKEKFHILIDGANISKDYPITIKDDFSEISFMTESYTDLKHTIKISVLNYFINEYYLYVNNSKKDLISCSSESSISIESDKKINNIAIKMNKYSG